MIYARMFYIRRSLITRRRFLFLKRRSFQCSGGYPLHTREYALVRANRCTQPRAHSNFSARLPAEVSANATEVDSGRRGSSPGNPPVVNTSWGRRRQPCTAARRVFDVGSFSYSSSLFLFPFQFAAAGQGTGASIIGQVTDQSGAVLPGVTVTATSPALQVPQVTASRTSWASTAWRRCRLASIRSRSSWRAFGRSSDQDVRLTVGFTARIDVALGLATVAETVTVSGAAPVVDVASTSGSTLFTKEMLELTPTSRNALSFLTLAPGVRSFLDIGGNQMVETRRARAFGQGGKVWYTIEGISTAAGRAASGTRKRSTRRASRASAPMRSSGRAACRSTPS